MTVMDVARGQIAPPRDVNVAWARTAVTRRSGWEATYRRYLVGGDLLVSMLLAGLAGWSSGMTVELAAVPVAWMAMAALSGAYRPNLLGAGAHDARAVLLAGVLVLAALPIAEKVGALGPVTGSPAVETILGIVLLAGLGRGVARWSLKARQRSGSRVCAYQVIVAGSAESVLGMVARLRRASDTVVAVGVAVPESQRAAVRHLELPTITLSDDGADSVVRLAREQSIDGVLLVPDGEVADTVLRRLARACEWANLRVLYAPAVVDVATSAPVIPVAGVPVLSVPRPGPSGAGRFAKSLVDRAGAGLGLLVLAPVLMIIALAIRYDSPGPALFRQVRLGESGRPFQIVKFRTMRQDAEAQVDELKHLNESDGPLFKLRQDPRVTRVGSLLRSSSLDELPQLINVLLGHMSLVGPRPPLLTEVADYSDAERRRLLVKPGLTGLWQVGGRSNLTWVDSVRLDLRYVESWSLPLDIRILCRTVPAVLRRTGAY